MDQDRFDQLARAFGSSRSRRSLLKALAGGALAAVAGTAGGDASANSARNCRSVGNSCEGNGNCCSHNCVKESRTRRICHCQSAADCPASTNPCLSPVCSPDGSCATTVNVGAACNDGNLCTVNDACQADGSCAGASKNCNDNNLCTTDFCDAATGNCVHTPIALNCIPSDQCHVAGICDPNTGQCTDPAAADGITCDDGNACTQTDTCQAGVCTGGNPVVCQPLDQCHDAGICTTTTGLCSNPDKSDDTPCNNGNHCTMGDTCQAGTCTGGAAVVCTASGPCVTSTCDPASGCAETPKASGIACDDATLCNGQEMCDGGGHCVAGTPVSCSPCMICNPATGTCDPDPAQVGHSCPSNGNLCEGGFQCTAAGTCAPTTFVTCTALDQCHVAGVCNPTSGACTNPNAGDGAACNDNNLCTQTDTCQAGVCTGGNPVVCSASDQCHEAGTCNTSTGVCSNPPVTDGTSCGSGQTCCGGTCGSCSGFDTCGGGGTPGQCGCTPFGCGNYYGPCITQPNGCGALNYCGYDCNFQ